MKSILYTFIFIISLPFTGLAQDCITENLVFYTQEEVDNFPINYPSCSEIIYNLNIQSSEVYNLDSLYQITSIGGNLTLYFCTEILDISGLENLNYVGGNLRIDYANSLTSLTGLESIDSIGGFLSLVNTSLTDISALENIASESIDEIFIYNNSQLSNCNAQSICDFISAPTGAVNIYNNAEGCNYPAEIAEQCGISIDCLAFGNYYFNSQSDIDNIQVNYPNCNTFLGDVIIDGNDITNLDSLDYISSIENLVIKNNNLLTDITGIENVSIDSNLSIFNNPALTECNIQSICNYLVAPLGIISIHSNGELCNSPTDIASECGITLDCLPYGNYYFYSQSDIDNFSINYPSCTQLEGDVFIEGDMTNLLGLSEVTSIGNYLSIVLVPNLQSLEGLESLTSVGGWFDIGLADSLIDLSGLENLSTLNNGIYIYYNENLASLDGLENLETLNLDLYLMRNDNLSDLGALSNLTEINGRIIIDDNEVLENLSGLDNISSINGTLQFTDNVQLNDLSALSNLTDGVTFLRISGNENLESLNGINNISIDSLRTLVITDNPLLSYCSVESVCNYLAYSDGLDLISNNSNGCLSEDEVETNCVAFGIEEEDELSVSIYPNPAKSELFISNESNIELEELIIYNQMGQEVMYLNKVESRIDISSLQSGVYLIEIRSSDINKKQIFIKN